MLVASCTASMPAPAQSASCTSDSRPSRGTPHGGQQRVDVDIRRDSPASEKTASGFSRDRSAFCRASGKLRPIAMASPTLFMVVVRVGSACGNFSKANRGTLTTM